LCAPAMTASSFNDDALENARLVAAFHLGGKSPP
jgi:hypothetical protein